MTTGTKKRKRPSSGIGDRAYLWGMICILLLSTALRVYALEADLPLHLTLSQGATTDGPITVGAGRIMAQRGDWNPNEPGANSFYKWPGMSLISYSVFRALGVGLWQANLIAVIAGILTIVFTASFAREQFGRRSALFTAAFLATNYVYVMYNRTSIAYTPLTCGLAMALYFWQRGLRNDLWFVLSGLVLALSILFINLLGLSLLPALVLGMVMVSWRRHCSGSKGVFAPFILFGLGLLAGAGLWYLFVYTPKAQMVSTFLSRRLNTFEAEQGIGDNLRFAVQSVIQFGIRSGFFVQMLPLFVLAYVYALVRGAQTLTAERPRFEPGEFVALLALACAVLTLLASTYRPTRYLVILIPPMSLLAGLALDRGLQLSRLWWPSAFSRLMPPLMMLGLSYLYYQLLAAMDKGLRLLEVGTGLADFRTIASGATLFRLVGIALLLGVATTLLCLRLALRSSGRSVVLPAKRIRLWVALTLIAVTLLVDGVQYLSWARSPAYSIAQASRQIEHDLGTNVTLGGPYAHVLAIENNLPVIHFSSMISREGIAKLNITHVVVEADSLLNNGPYNDERFHLSQPELMQQAQLVGTYTLRGYVVKVYEMP